eukprot:TRINITY_DN101679_c0_g1_i1.p1 TRINITY_DN101679_c0_g1~~TRINITY_DN101679_c0_g1_i1.p1  ORF type:complete len:582 (-),score=92.66 TRINITY_DN101679_c0_g1_i1:4-1749(-)
MMMQRVPRVVRHALRFAAILAAWMPTARSADEAPSNSARGMAGCNCTGQWDSVLKEMWLVFDQDIDVASVMDCLSDGLRHCQLEEPRLQTAARLLGSEECSEEGVPTVDEHDCPAAMVHVLLFCMLQMWVRGFYRQAALYYDQALGFLAMARHCLAGSEWPLWSGQVLRNFQGFLKAAFPAGELRAEIRTAGGGDDEPEVTYTVVGPKVNASAFRWLNGPREGLYCPPTPERPEEMHRLWHRASAPTPLPRVMCAVPLVWPGEREQAKTVAETFGQNCDELTFFLSASDEAVVAEARDAVATWRTGASVVDLAEEWPWMVRDSDAALHAQGRRQVSGANQKDLLLFAHLWRKAAGERRGWRAADWVCRVETDSYFAPGNFLRFLALRGLNADEPHFLGSLSYWHMHFEPRLVFNEQVQCLSWAAVMRLGEVVATAPTTSDASYSRCELAPGHRGDIMLALCLAHAGIVPHPDIADAWGREYFLNYRLEDIAIYAPDNAYGPSLRDPRNLSKNAAQHWRGKPHVFMPCLGYRQHHAASLYPISFHDYKDPKGLQWVHEVLTGVQACNLCPKGYTPRLHVWDS